MIKKAFSIVILLLLGLFIMPPISFAKGEVSRLKENFSSLEQYRNVIEDIADQGDSAVLELIELANEKTWTKSAKQIRKNRNAKVTALNLLGEIASASALDTLEQILIYSDNPSLIINSARAIGNTGGKKSFKILKKALRGANKGIYSRSNKIKQASIIAIGLCGDKRGIKLLRKELNNPDNSEITLIYTAGSLGLLGENEGFDIAAKGLKSLTPRIRLSSIRALGIIDTVSSEKLIEPFTFFDVKMTYKKTARLSMAQLECNKASKDKKAEMIQNYLTSNPKTTDFIQWGTRKLKKMNTDKSREILQDFSRLEAPKYSLLRHAAKIKLKTLK
ncbi:MAG: hypothetical protein GY710_22725 [Desulfobacteraceae bacterium]|nr:hypothetical protein [Desulfobacteraceae bacterium]